MKRAILTIDDSPSTRTVDLVDFCIEKKAPPILFCRGDRMDAFGTDGLRYALDQGVLLAHHSYHHKPAGEWGFDAWRDDFLKMQDRLQKLYDQAGIAWSRKLYRFPYVDRGDGDRIERRFPDLAKGQTIDTNDRVDVIQQCLRQQGYTQDFGCIIHPLYRNEAVAQAFDCLFTYSVSDWMLTERHKGQQRYINVDALKQAMDDDVWLNNKAYDHIVLAHDEGEIYDVTCTLIAHMADSGFVFTERV